MARTLISSIRLLTGKLVETLTSNAEPESSSSAGQNKQVREDLEHLHRTLRRIQALLRDAEDREIRDQSVEIWLSDLRGVAHEAEDVLDEYQYELTKFTLEDRDDASETSNNKGSKRKMDKSRFSSPASSSSYFGSTTFISNISVPGDLADRIKRIKNKFQEIFDAHDKFSLREEDGERRFHGAQKRPPSTSLVEERGVVGREVDKENVINLLISERSSFVVIPIVGMGGVGKTTLAQLIYNDSRVSELFDQRAWVSVSDDFDVIRLTREIIVSITGKNCNITQPNKLQEDLMGKLKGRKFLLVLDDVWNEQRNLWEHFRVSLKNAQYVRILTTSRCTFAAQIMQTVSPYHLDSLLEDQSWILFKNSAFGIQNPTEQLEFEEIGRKIVRKCGGLPLAIKALGGILRYEREMEMWVEVLESYIWELDVGRENFLSTLRLSYYMMPSHLRPCFLYFSMFPKDKEFKKDQLVRLWMAQGYVHPQSNKRLEDIGKKYFNELYGRSLLLSFSKYGETMYKMHAMIHDMAASFSTRICSGISYGVDHLYISNNQVLTNFLSLKNPRALRTLLNHRFDAYCSGSFIISLAYCLRVLDVDFYGTELPESIGNLKHLRYLCVAGHNMRRLPESLGLLYNMQTLDLQNCSFVLDLPQGIGKLVNLRFLRLYSQEIKKLPDSICLLHNLQMLDLKCCFNLSELPSGIEQLTSLCYLDISHCKVKNIIPGIGKLTNLQNMQAILYTNEDDSHTGLGVLKDLLNLRGTLSISGLENVIDPGYSRDAHMISKHNLRNVKLRWRVNSKLEHHYFINDDEVKGKLYLKVSSNGSQDVMDTEETDESVLDSLQPNNNVMNLTLCGYNGLKFPHWIGDPCSLAKVTTLVLEDSDVRKENLSCLGHLPSLKYLFLVKLGIRVFGESEENRRNYGEISFPSLETLEFRYMNNWEQFLIFDGDFPRLRKLSVEGCPILSELQTFSSLHSLYINECKRLGSLNLCKHNLVNNSYEMGLSELQQLEVIDCDLSVISLPLKSKVWCVHINRCQNLTCILHLENNNSITDLRLTSCPELNLPEIMPMPDKFQIIDCSYLKQWSHDHKIYYFQKISPTGMLTIHNDQDITINRYGFINSCAEYLCIKPYYVGQSQERNEFISYQFCIRIWGTIPYMTNLSRIIRLELLYCKKVISVEGLNFLIELKHLEIWNCPEICQLIGEFLPSTLECLVVKECEKLCSIPSFKQSSALKELQLWNCEKLTAIMDMHCSISLKTLMVIQCTELRISPFEILQSKLENVVIRDCPLVKEWCHMNDIPYAQWFNDVPNEEEDGGLLQVQRQLTNFMFEQIEKQACA